MGSDRGLRKEVHQEGTAGKRGINSLGASQVALVVKNLPANAGDMCVGFLGWEKSLEEGMATHSRILA